MGRIEELWGVNFITNVEKNNFSKPNVKSLRYLINTLDVKLKQKPVILVGAGPSLDNTIEKLKQYKDKLIIIATDVVAPTLCNRYNVKPDFICTVDPHNTIPKILAEVDCKIPLIAPITVNPLLFDIYKGNIYLFNMIDENKVKNELLNTFNIKAPQMSYIYNSLFVGGTCLQFATILKPETVFLMGYDLAFTDDKVYCEGVLEDRFKYSSYETKEEFSNKLLSTSILTNNIKTSKLFKIYEQMFMRLVSSCKTKVVNCSGAGILTKIECNDIELYDEYLKEKISKSSLKKY